MNCIDSQVYYLAVCYWLVLDFRHEEAPEYCYSGGNYEKSYAI